MRRREFIAALVAAGSPMSLPRGAFAQQQPGKLFTIGFFGATTPSAQKQWNDAFEQRLRELGWIKGRNIGIEYRFAYGDYERAGEVFPEFVRLKVDAIVTHTGVLASAAKRATSLTPIIFALAADPVGDGVVAGLAQPGGNATGISVQSADTAGKRLELLAAIMHRVARFCTSGWRSRVDDPSGWIGVRPLAVQRVWG